MQANMWQDSVLTDLPKCNAIHARPALKWLVAQQLQTHTLAGHELDRLRT